MGGCHFKDAAEVQVSSKEVGHRGFQKCLEQLYEVSHNCVATEECYFEGNSF